jgi:DNA topoisomerase-1
MNTITVSVKNGVYILKASGSSIEFDGFMKIYDYTLDEDAESTNFPELTNGEILEKKKINLKQHFTQPPARYSEATLVKTLEDNGIGRPSTYSPTISTLLDRKYIEREKKTIIPTELGFIVNNIVSDYFKKIVDVEFTAEMENKLDNIEEGKVNWKQVVDEFFSPLIEIIEIAEREIAKITIEDKPTDIQCDKCGKFMVVKHGRFGDFLACPGYPECKNTKPMLDEIDVECPLCSGKVILRKSKKGRKFYGCGNYPECKFVSWFEPTEKKCPKCNSFMMKKENKTKGKFLECSSKECKNIILEE